MPFMFLVLIITSIQITMMINPLYSLQEQQAHVEQFALTAQQILQEASDILQYRVGDKESTISRLYQLQIAVDAHQFSDAGFSNTLLNGLDELVYDVASVDGVAERGTGSFWDPSIGDLLQHEAEHELEQQQQTIQEKLVVLLYIYLKSYEYGGSGMNNNNNIKNDKKYMNGGKMRNEYG
eukprot:286170_1